MKRRTCALFFFVSSVLVGCFGGPAAEPVPVDDGREDEDDEAPVDDDVVDMSADLASLSITHGLPALAAAVSNDEGIIARGVTGVRKVDDDTPATFDDRWHLGSDTKAMTATLIALHVEAGDLVWDTPLAELFPDVELNTGYADITLPQLLTHQGGAPAEFDDDIFEALFAAGPLSDVRRDAVEMILTRPPTQAGTFVYSNGGYLIAGAALEAVTGTPWEELLTAEIFAPLGMQSCGFGPTATGSQVDGPWGHTVVDGTLTPFNIDNPAALGPAGTVHCSLTDWLKFLREHLRGAQQKTTTLALAPSTWTLLQTPASADGNAFGWFSIDQGWSNGPALAHVGSNTLNVADVWVTPGLNRIFVSVTNRGDDNGLTGADAAIALLVTQYASE